MDRPDVTVVRCVACRKNEIGYTDTKPEVPICNECTTCPLCGSPNRVELVRMITAYARLGCIACPYEWDVFLLSDQPNVVMNSQRPDLDAIEARLPNVEDGDTFALISYARSLERTIDRLCVEYPETVKVIREAVAAAERLRYVLESVGSTCDDH